MHRHRRHARKLPALLPKDKEPTFSLTPDARTLSSRSGTASRSHHSISGFLSRAARAEFEPVRIPRIDGVGSGMGGFRIRTSPKQEGQEAAAEVEVKVKRDVPEERSLEGDEASRALAEAGILVRGAEN